MRLTRIAAALLIAVAGSRGLAVSQSPPETPRPRDLTTPIVTNRIPFIITGTGTPGAAVTVSVDSHGSANGVVAADGTWSITWTEPLPTGTYVMTTTVGGASTGSFLRV